MYIRFNYKYACRCDEKEAAKQTLDVMVWAVAISAIELSWADADCILVASQNTSDLEKVKSIVKTSIPVEEINDIDFSKMDGKAVLNRAIELIVS